MTIAQRIAALAAALPPDKQAEVLDFVEFLQARSHAENEAVRPVRRLGTLAGQLPVPDDFDAPLPPDVLGSFEGGDEGVLGGSR